MFDDAILCYRFVQLYNTMYKTHFENDILYANFVQIKKPYSPE